MAACPGNTARNMAGRENTSSNTYRMRSRTAANLQVSMKTSRHLNDLSVVWSMNSMLFAILLQSV